jgi:hypothetical protein
LESAWFLPSSEGAHGARAEIEIQGIVGHGGCLFCVFFHFFRGKPLAFLSRPNLPRAGGLSAGTLVRLSCCHAGRPVTAEKATVRTARTTRVTQFTSLRRVVSHRTRVPPPECPNRKVSNLITRPLDRSGCRQTSDREAWTAFASRAFSAGRTGHTQYTNPGSRIHTPNTNLLTGQDAS